MGKLTGLLRSSLLILTLAIAPVISIISCSPLGGSGAHSPVGCQASSQPDYTPSTVLRQVALPTYKLVGPGWTGSAVAIAPRLVATAAHCVGEYTSSLEGEDPVFEIVEVTLWSRQVKPEFVTVAKVIKLDLPHDLALLETASDMPYFASVIDRPWDLTWFTPVVASGYSLGWDDSVVTTGHVTSVNSYEGMIQHTASTMPGNSGGPILMWSEGRWRVWGLCHAGAVQLGAVTVPHMTLATNPWVFQAFVIREVKKD